MKIVHAADIHLDSPLYGLELYEGAPVEEFRGASRRALENLADFCIGEGVACLLIAGDLYDGDWKDYSTGLFFVKQMARLRDADVRVFLVRGNHDAASVITKGLKLPDNVKEFSTARAETVVVEEHGLAIHGRGYAKRHMPDSLVADFPMPVDGCVNIGMLHTSLDAGGGEHAIYAPCTLDELRAKGYQYWALGHLHSRRVLCEDPWIVYPGNLQGRHMRETGSKGVTVVEIADGQIGDVRHQDLDVVRWSKIEVCVSSTSTPDDALELMRAQLLEAISTAESRPLAVRVEVRGETSGQCATTLEDNAWLNDARAVVIDESAGQAWLESVQVTTSTAPTLDGVDGPASEMMEYLRELSEDPMSLEVIGGQLAELTAKLPHEYRSLPDALDPSAPKALKPIVGRIEQLLLHRLLRNGVSR